MNAKEKAKELVDKYFYKIIEADRLDYNMESFNINIAKQCALIAVDEIIKLNCLSSGWQEGINLPITDTMRPYWQEVKIEIEKL